MRASSLGCSCAFHGQTFFDQEPYHGTVEQRKKGNRMPVRIVPQVPGAAQCPLETSKNDFFRQCTCRTSDALLSRRATG